MKENFMQRQRTHNESFLPLIDLNCDLAQAWGVFKYTEEEALLPYVTSVNISCGGHAGDLKSITRAVKLAKERGLSIGAHLGYPDLQGFGRRELTIPWEEIKASLFLQLGLLEGVARNCDVQISHVRLHGALSEKCCNDVIFAGRLSECLIRFFSDWVIFLGPPGNYLNAMHECSGIRTITEISLDKIYRKDSSRKPYSSYKAPSIDFGISQAKSLIYQGRLLVEGGMRNRISFRSIHLDMNRPFSLQLAETVHRMVTEANRLGSFVNFNSSFEFDPRDFAPIHANEAYSSRVIA